MALQKSIDLPGNLGSVDGYWTVQHYAVNRENGALQLVVVSFKDAATRAALKQSNSTIDQVKAAKADQARAYNDARAAAKTDEQKKAVAKQRDKMLADFQQMDQQIEAAAADRGRYGTLPGVEPRTVQIANARALGIMDQAGGVDMAKLYTWLKTQPGFEGAADC